METSIYYKYSQLATASYVDLSQESSLGNPQRLATIANEQERLPQLLATQFFDSTTGWGVLGDPRHRLTNGGVLHDDPDSGFAATLFRNNSTGEKVLAIRGTDPGRDGQLRKDLLEADISHIGFSGVAYKQLVSLFNMVQRFRAPAGESNVLQLTVREGSAPPNPDYAIQIRGTYYRWLEPRFDGIGQGVLGSTDAVVAVGHSLGGHLAAMARRLFPEIFASAVIFNAPGYDPVTSEKLTGAYLNLFRQFGANPVPAFSQITSLISEDTVPGDDISIVPSIITGTRYGTDLLVTTELNSHVIEPIMDSVAPQSLLYSMNASLSLDDAGKVLKAATNTAGKSDEALLESLYLTLMNERITLDSFAAVLASAGAIAPRRTYYQRLVELEAAIKANTALSLQSLVGKPTDEIKAEAAGTGGLAYRFALRELNPFAIAGVNYDAFHNASGELDRYDVTKDSGISDRWLEDRSKFLGALVRYNTEDRNDKVAPGDTAYRDGERQLTLRPFAPTKGMAFAKAGQQLSARDLAPEADLFGTNGADTILGSAGKSYVEAGAGDDKVTTFDGNDQIHGGAGSDTISSGSGADVIIGGKDGDAELRGGDDNDIVWGDEDQTDARYTGANYGGHDNLYGEDGNDFLYGGGGNDRLEGGKGVDQLFGDGMDVEDTERSGFDILVGGEDGDFAYGGEGVDTIYGDKEEVDGTVVGGADFLQGNKGDDFLYGGGGADTILGGEGKDEIVGGHGSDVALFGGAGDDTIYGGLKDENDTRDQGYDKLFGEAGEDKLYGGAGQDRLFGGDEDDTLRGGLGNDFLEGGDGYDIYEYKIGDGRDILVDSDGAGHIDWEGMILSGGENKNGPGDFVYYDDPDEWQFKYETVGDSNEGPVTLFISTRQHGLILEVQDFLNSDLLIDLEDGDPKKPNPPLLPNGNGGGSAQLPPPPPPGGTPPPRRGDPLVLDVDGLGITTLGVCAAGG
ncbi:MAG: calcium-binding protein [Burkholderiales bacterium]